MSTPSGWYPDTQATGGERFWDGQAWTDQRRPTGQAKASAGWYNDPTMVDTRRYWDGENWTEHRQAGATSPAAPAAGPETKPWFVKVLAGVGVAAIVLVAAYFVVGGRSAGTAIDVTELTTSIQADLKDQGETVTDLECDDPGEVETGDITYCRGSSGQRDVTLKVTFERDGGYSWETL